MPDQAEQLRIRMEQTENGGSAAGVGTQRVIAVASGKGGVGKSNFCVNFALSLQEMGHRVVVLDADMGFANVEILLGVHPTHTIVDLLDGCDIWDIVHETETGLPFISAGNGLMDIHSLMPSQVEHLLNEMKKLQDVYDTIIVDSGAGMGTNMSRLLAAADDLVLLTTPEPTAITDAYALIKLLGARGRIPPTQIVVNRAQQIVEGKLAADKLRMVADRFLNVSLGVMGYLLEDDSVQQAVMRQQPLLKAFPKSSAARCYKQLVSNYLRVEVEKPRTGIQGFFDRLFRRDKALNLPHGAVGDRV